MLMINSDESIPAYQAITEAVHELNTPIILQIAHAGRQTRSKITGFRPVAPSAIRDRYFNEEIPRALNDEEIEGVIKAFVQAAIRAKSAGFDCVQIHAAHGYLLAEFLSPYMNLSFFG